MAQLNAESLPDLSSGAVFLATGGGGDPYVALLSAQQALAEHGGVELIAVDELDDDAFVAAIGSVGAPTASLELLPSTDDPAKALAVFEKHVGRKLDAVVSFEIGGGNSLIPLIAVAGRGIPVVDGDGMGRALPEAQMMTYPIAGIPSTPAVALDYLGNIATFSTDSTETYERHIRAMAQAMGGMITTVEHPMSGKQLKSSVVPGTVSFATGIGRILRRNRGNAPRILAPLRKAFAGSMYGEPKHLFTGKVTDYTSAIIGGYDIGKAMIETFDGSGPKLEIEVKNEYLLARIDGQVAASVPDLIIILDFETSTPINAERLRYGQRVTVLGIACPDFYRSQKALARVSPRNFGFNIDYTPLENLTAHHQPLPPAPSGPHSHS